MPRSDFNSLDREGRMVMLREEAPDAQPGDRLTVYDAEGNQAEGIVRVATDRLVYLRIDWSTWNPSSGPETDRRDDV